MVVVDPPNAKQKIKNNNVNPNKPNPTQQLKPTEPDPPEESFVAKVHHSIPSGKEALVVACAFAFVAVCIPIQPAKPENEAPTTKAKLLNGQPIPSGTLKWNGTNLIVLVMTQHRVENKQ